MAGGWTRDGALHDQIEASIDSEVERARARLGQGESLTHCEECDTPIPERRREALPGVRTCVRCQSEQDRADREHALFNRRGSKDSQLK